VSHASAYEYDVVAADEPMPSVNDVTIPAFVPDVPYVIVSEYL
jgi:hypothetical protein